MKYIALTTVLGIASLSGCASTSAPPRELVEARAAFSRASQGPAARLALVDLHNAQGELERAERSFTEAPGSDVTRDLSYVALRRAQTVEARGDTLQADQERERAEQERAALTGQQLTQTQTALQRSQQQLQNTQQTVALTQTQLAAERQRRVEAERQAAAALESLRRVAAVREEQRGTIITLSGEVLFATGESTLLPIAQQRLDQVARALIDQGARHLVVEGHTDSRGSPAANQQLSLARAQSVRAYLISRGIPEGQIEASGLGPSRPVAPNETAEGRANNRRVEIVVSPAAGVAR
ncbi:MAG: OmpA family protein [Deltaproteobacteria bacterium]|nr:OmpA family protein [Deltaproteobacteria bacterium]